MTWTYVIETGAMLWPAGNRLSTGYSGAPGAVNDPSKISIIDVGPIPVGLWLMQSPYDDDETGPFTIPLLPAESTELYGRSGFKIHGDSVVLAGLEKASKGCIVLNRFAREAMWNNEVHTLNVVAYA